MDAPEIILNLWYVCDELGTVYSLRGRCYLSAGTDAEKLSFLRQFAATDYLIASVFPVPKRLHTILVVEEDTRELPVTNTEFLELCGGPEVLFEEVFVELEKQLPAQSNLSIGSDPVVCITPLLSDEVGHLRPIDKPRRGLRSREHVARSV